MSMRFDATDSVALGESAYSSSAAVSKPSALSVLAPQAGQIAIVGAGNAAQSVGCFLSSQGMVPQFLVRSPEKVKNLCEKKQISATGRLSGDFEIAGVSSDVASVLANAKTIFVATTTDAYGEIAMRLAPHLTGEHEVILFSSKFAGVVEFKMALGPRPMSRMPILVETDSLFASRIKSDESVWIRGIKEWTLFSSWCQEETTRSGALIRRFFPNLGKAENVVQRGLTDFGALAHPITMLANMNSIDRGGGFLFYRDGLTEKTIVLMEKVEEEFHQIAEAFDTNIVPMRELLNKYYGCDTSSLLQAMRTVPNYSLSQAPDTLDHRYIHEDVASSLVPMRELAAKAGLKTPMLDSIINLSTVLLGRDFAKDGRTLTKLGWSKMTHSEILRAINA